MKLPPQHGNGLDLERRLSMKMYIAASGTAPPTLAPSGGGWPQPTNGFPTNNTFVSEANFSNVFNNTTDTSGENRDHVYLVQALAVKCDTSYIERSINVILES